MAADGSVVLDVDLNVSDAEKELARLKNSIVKTETDLRQNANRKSILAEKVKQAKEQYISLQKSLRSFRFDELDTNPEAIKIGEKMQQIEGYIARTETDIEQVNRAIEKGEVSLEAMKRTYGEVAEKAKELPPASNQMGEALKRAKKSAEVFGRRLKSLFLSAFIFNILSAGLRQFTAWLGNAVKSNDRAAAAISRLKGALLTLVQPILSVVIPVFITLVNLLTKVASAIASVVSAVFGTTAEESAAAAESLYNQQKGLNGVGAAAKKAGKQLAAFDEINKLSSDTADAAGGGAGGGGDIKPEFDSSFIGEELDKISTLVGGALLAVGAILTFSGVKVSVGLALMAAGAVTLGKVAVENWGAIVTALQGPLGLIVGVLSGALLVLGAVLTFTGADIPLGLGLMAVGAVGLGAAMAANWEAIQAALQGPLGIITGMVSAALLVLGAILTFTGANIPLGIGLLFAGAIGLATTMAANWETIQALLQGPVGAITAIVSGALLVLGAVLTFTGANLPLGIGLLVAGAVGLATTIAANWETIQSALRGPIGVITAIVSTALLVIGAVLLFSGAAVPLGLGMIVVGAVGLAATIAANWEVIQTTLGGKIEAITAMVSAALLVLGIILIFTGAGIPLGLGMLIAGGAGLVATVAPNWNFILEKLQDAWESVKEWWDTHVAKFFTWDYWKGLGKSCIDGLFGGFELGSKVKNWGKSMLGEVEDTFGIHSPSTEFRELGEYMMAGLLGGINNQSAAVETAFSALFAAVTALCTQNTGLMQAALVAFLLYLTAEFGPDWKKSWETCYQNAHSQILLVLRDIDTLNARLAAIERNITVTITTVRREVNEVAAPRSALPAASKMAKMPAIRQADVPALAKGAVIPPNRAFLAVLGDQKSGANVEAPAGLIRQMVAEGIRAAGSAGGTRDIHITLELDRQVFARAVYRANNDETQRVGVRFAGVRA